MTKWEYKVETRSMSLEGEINVETLFNEFGGEGWELISIIPEYTNTTNDQNQIDSIYVNTYTFVFKRPKQ
ncbi:DUF4177 domain-containing protein [Ureibacillus sp. FSL K6-8385]|mgnify:CR=1 FL=1|uniref:DUF4177 domain-containing protein n=1 Tax=Ureibacillus TaxID=160795 RepID=UPI002E21DBB0|nr:DUF4177 domain-containing protein [Ureibacillus terrenus]